MLEDSGARLLFAEDQEQVDKFLDGGAAHAGVAGVVYTDDRGLWHYEEPLLVPMERFVAEAPDDAATRARLEACIAAGTDADLAALCYTSGTTGKPKGVRLTHRYLLDNAYRLVASFGMAPHIDYFSYISAAWAAEQITGLGLGLLAPSGGALRREARDRAGRPARDRPRVPALHAAPVGDDRLLDRGADARREAVAPAPLRMGGGRAGGAALARRRAGAARDPRRHRPEARALSDQRRLGLSAEIFRRFHALGVPLRNLYGSTEAGLISAHWGEDGDPGTLGRPLKVARSSGEALRLRIAADGELLVRGGAGFCGYRGDAEASRRMLDAEGYYRTGDAMHASASGELVFLDRVKDMRRLSTGERFPPQTIENHLRASAFLRDAIVLGDERRGFIGALLNVDAGIFGRYLERRNIGWGTFAELSQLEAVLERVALEVARVNALLPEHSRIARFATLPKELDADDAELTRSRKLQARRHRHPLRAAHREPVRRRRGLPAGRHRHLPGRQCRHGARRGAHPVDPAAAAGGSGRRIGRASDRWTPCRSSSTARSPASSTGWSALAFVVIYRASRIVNLAQGQLVLLGAYLTGSLTAGSAAARRARPGARPQRARRRLHRAPRLSPADRAAGVLDRDGEHRPADPAAGPGAARLGRADAAVRADLPRGRVAAGPLVVNKRLVIGAAITLAAVEAMRLFFMKTRVGLRLAAVAEDHFVALSLGVSVKGATRIAWALGALLSTTAAMILLSGNVLGPAGQRHRPARAAGGPARRPGEPARRRRRRRHRRRRRGLRGALPRPADRRRDVADLSLHADDRRPAGAAPGAVRLEGDRAALR